MTTAFVPVFVYADPTTVGTSENPPVYFVPPPNLIHDGVPSMLLVPIVSQPKITLLYCPLPADVQRLYNGHCPSGEKSGWEPFAVPGMGRPSSWSRRRAYNIVPPPGVATE